MNVHVAFSNPSQPGEIEITSENSKKSIEAIVLVDIFRSSTTIVEALNNGAKCVMPCSTVEEAKKKKYELEKKGHNIFLVGEKQGIMPDGFDLNISPQNMQKKIVKGKEIVYCSTNLTRILSECKFTRNILIGGFTNANAVAKYLEDIGIRNVVIVACGAFDMIAIEDVIGSGAIIKNLNKENLTDSAMLSLMVYENQRWKESITKGRVANYLRNIGFGEDLKYCIREDTSTIVPILKKGVLIAAD